MKHPLTSKERRGLLAVAAAALLCVGSGFVFRNCTSRSHPNAALTVIDNDSVSFVNGSSDSITGKSESQPKDSITNGKRARRAKRKSAAGKKNATYPTRQPLDEPCD